MKFSIEYHITEPAGGDERIHQIIREGLLSTQQHCSYYKLDGTYIVLPKLDIPIKFKIIHHEEDTNGT